MTGTALGRALRAGEVLSLAAGAVLSLFFVAQLAQGEVGRRAEIAEFENRQQSLVVDSIAAPDTSLWAPQRIADYEAARAMQSPAVLGVLEMPSVGLKVPVYPSDSELNMDRGAGIIDGMAYPHEGGNIGIAGHRDGYFRALKDVALGDRLSLDTLEGKKHFTVTSLQVVEIDDRSVLQDTDDQTVTLITCYPFYFVGHAPQRFVVTAALDATDVKQQ
jgi:sortase A